MRLVGLRASRFDVEVEFVNPCKALKIVALKVDRGDSETSKEMRNGGKSGGRRVEVEAKLEIEGELLILNLILLERDGVKVVDCLNEGVLDLPLLTKLALPGETPNPE